MAKLHVQKLEISILYSKVSYRAFCYAQPVIYAKTCAPNTNTTDIIMPL